MTIYSIPDMIYFNKTPINLWSNIYSISTVYFNMDRLINFLLFGKII